MHASAIFASFAGLVGLTVAAHGHGRPEAAPEAAPAVPEEWVHHPQHANNTHSQEKRGALGMNECSRKNWYGPCTWTKADGGSCHNKLYSKSDSMGPDQGLTCTLYGASNCLTASNKRNLNYFQPPGVPDYQKNAWLASANLATDGPSSYKCHRL